MIATRLRSHRIMRRSQLIKDGGEGSGRGPGGGRHGGAPKGHDFYGNQWTKKGYHRPKPGELERILADHKSGKRRLAMVPAQKYIDRKHVLINDDKDAKRQLVWMADSPTSVDGFKEQSGYLKAHDEAAQSEKHERVSQLTKALRDKLHTKAKKDAKTNDNAAVAMLLMHTGMRVDSETQQMKAAKAAHLRRYGGSSLERRHVAFRTVGGKRVAVLTYIPGKPKKEKNDEGEATGEGKPVQVTITHPDVVKMLEEKHSHTSKPNDRLFPKARAAAVDDYTANVIGDGFKNHDLRTSFATTRAQDLVAAHPMPNNMRELKAAKNTVGDHVAALINDTRSVALSRYINPEVFRTWEEHVGNSSATTQAARSVGRTTKRPQGRPSGPQRAGAGSRESGAGGKARGLADRGNKRTAERRGNNGRRRGVDTADAYQSAKQTAAEYGRAARGRLNKARKVTVGSKTFRVEEAHDRRPKPVYRIKGQQQQARTRDRAFDSRIPGSVRNPDRSLKQVHIGYVQLHVMKDKNNPNGAPLPWESQDVDGNHLKWHSTEDDARNHLFSRVKGANRVRGAAQKKVPTQRAESGLRAHRDTGKLPVPDIDPGEDKVKPTVVHDNSIYGCTHCPNFGVRNLKMATKHVARHEPKRQKNVSAGGRITYSLIPAAVTVTTKDPVKPREAFPSISGATSTESTPAETLRRQKAKNAVERLKRGDKRTVNNWAAWDAARKKGIKKESRKQMARNTRHEFYPKAEGNEFCLHCDQKKGHNLHKKPNRESTPFVTFDVPPSHQVKSHEDAKYVEEARKLRQRENVMPNADRNPKATRDAAAERAKARRKELKKSTQEIVDEAIEQTIDYCIAKYDVSPLGTSKKNWVSHVGGLPLFVRAIAHALIRHGHPKSQAIAIAVGSAKRWARGGGKVRAKTRIKSAGTVAEWERKRAESRLKHLGRVKKDDDVQEIIEVTGEISKIDRDRKQVFGWAYVTHDEAGELNVDKSGEFIDDPEELEKMAYTFVLHSRQGGQNHQRTSSLMKGDAPVVKSTMIESMVFTPEKIHAMGLDDGALPVGWWTGWQIHDDEAWADVKAGRAKMFSIHGTGTRAKVA